MSENQKENQQLAKVKTDISAQVLAKVEEFREAGELRIPADYSPENALKSAYIVLSETKTKEGKSVLEHCSKASIAQALLKMVVWGLSPLKKQCYFIPFGDKLECTPDYSGNILLAKRYAGLKHIVPVVVFEGDEFEFGIDTTTGRKTVINHKQTLDSLDKNKVKGAYAVIEMEDGTTNAEIMSISMIEKAWQQGAAKGNSPAHSKFPDQMAIKTVINRACKLLIRSSDDSALYTKDETEEEPIDVAAEDVKHQIKSNANKTPFDFEDAEIEDVQEEKNEIFEKSEPELFESKGAGF